MSPPLESKAPHQPTTNCRRFIGVRQRPSGRWVAEIKDSIQRVRLWLGTYDSPEDAAHAYDEAARALRRQNVRTNFSLISNLPPTHLTTTRHGKIALRPGLINTNLQKIIARSAASDHNNYNKSSSNTRVMSDHTVFASIFHYKNNGCDLINIGGDDHKSIEKAVEPSFIVPHNIHESKRFKVSSSVTVPPSFTAISSSSSSSSSSLSQFDGENLERLDK